MAGKIMLHLVPYNYERIVQSDRFQATYGAGEANVAVSLAKSVEYILPYLENPEDWQLVQITTFRLRGADVSIVWR